MTVHHSQISCNGYVLVSDLWLTFIANVLPYQVGDIVTNGRLQIIQQSETETSTSQNEEQQKLSLVLIQARSKLIGAQILREEVSIEALILTP